MYSRKELRNLAIVIAIVIFCILNSTVSYTEFVPGIVRIKESGIIARIDILPSCAMRGTTVTVYYDPLERRYKWIERYRQRFGTPVYMAVVQ